MMKILTLATSMAMLAAVSGNAYAGATISDQRYWPDEIHRTSQPQIEQPKAAIEALASMRPSAQAEERYAHRYEGGPKSDD
jgi:hypothetical protein